LSNIVITDTLVAVIGGPITLEQGEVDSTTFQAFYVITFADLEVGFVENSAIVNGEIPPGLGLPATVSDVSDTGDPSETSSGNGSTDGDPTNDPVVLELCEIEMIACPSDWNVTHDMATNGCIAPSFNDHTEIPGEFNDCGNPDNISTSFEDFLIPEECTGGNTFDERTIERTYTFTNTLTGEIIGQCPQTLTFIPEECSPLSSFGVIASMGSTSLTVPGGCDLPLIEVAEGLQGVCGYVEYMWLVSTEEDPNGNPVIPTNLNVGTTWTIIDGENDAFLNPGVVIQNTYYVRCARNFSCCTFGESNIVSFLVDDTATCPVDDQDAAQIIEDCANPVILSSPTDNYFGSEQLIFITNQDAEISNKAGIGSDITIDAKQGVLGIPGMEIQRGATFKVYTEGCNED